MEWIVLLFRVPAEPSRHRVAVWRELRRTGAVSIGQSAWLAPAAPAFVDGVTRAVQLVQAAGGEAIVLDAAGHRPADTDRLAAVYTAAREAEWVEFVAECGKYLAEIDKEIDKAKLTLAELDEEEQSLERLRRWHRELRLRDVLKRFAHPGDILAGRPGSVVGWSNRRPP